MFLPENGSPIVLESKNFEIVTIQQLAEIIFHY